MQDNFQPVDANNSPNVGSYEVRSYTGSGVTSAVSFSFTVAGHLYQSDPSYTQAVQVENQTAYDAVSMASETFSAPNEPWFVGYQFRDPAAAALASDGWTTNFLRSTWPQITITGTGTGSGTRFRGVVASVGAFLRKFHTNIGAAANIYLSPTTPATIESRSGGASGNHTIFFVFDREISSAVAAVTSGIGSVSGALSFEGRIVVVNLTGVADDQYLTLTLTNIIDTASQAVADASATAGFLIGDANGDGTVNSGDAQQVRSRSGAPVDAYTPETYRCDLNGDGTINAGDAFIARSRSGNSLLP